MTHQKHLNRLEAVLDVHEQETLNASAEDLAVDENVEAAAADARAVAQAALARHQRVSPIALPLAGGRRRASGRALVPHVAQSAIKARPERLRATYGAGTDIDLGDDNERAGDAGDDDSTV